MYERREWRLIDTGTGNGAWNMAVDETLMESSAQEGRPILRVYGWQPCVSAGRFSNVENTVDTEGLEMAAVPLVRRITGGGILVHGDDLSYALIVPRGMMEGAGVKENYTHWCRFLIRLYEGLGFEARFASHQKRNERSPVCLFGIEPFDLLIDGKKMGGNAQRHTRAGFLQHGSIPIHLDRERFERMFLASSGLDEAASLRKLGCPLSADELKIELYRAFSQSYSAVLSEEPLSEGEIARASELVRRKYGTPEWNGHGTVD